MTGNQQRVYALIKERCEGNGTITSREIAAALALSSTTVGYHLSLLRRDGLIVYFPQCRRWSIPRSAEVALPDTWNMNRARAFGITVRLMDDAPESGRLVRVGFDFDYLWPKSRTHRIDWQMELNGSLTLAIHEVIRQTARGLETSEAEAELYLLRHAKVRTERRERLEVMA